ncbi:hypothetical protein GCM10009748_32140 [Agromyces lapidis]
MAAAGLAIAGLFVLAGCAPRSPGGGPFGDGSQAERVVRGMPEGWTGPDPDLLDGEPVVGWVSDTEFGVVTMGSSSCPAVARELEVLGAREVQIEFGQSPNDPCTADMAATTHVFELPPTVDGRPVTVIVKLDGFEPEFALELE